MKVFKYLSFETLLRLKMTAHLQEIHHPHIRAISWEINVENFFHASIFVVFPSTNSKRQLERASQCSDRTCLGLWLAPCFSKICLALSSSPSSLMAMLRYLERTVVCFLKPCICDTASQGSFSLPFRKEKSDLYWGCLSNSCFKSAAATSLACSWSGASVSQSFCTAATSSEVRRPMVRSLCMKPRWNCGA